MKIEKIKETLLRYDFIQFALLFGSYASGKDGYLSDIDIAIETDMELDLLTYGEIISEIESSSDKKTT